MTTISTCIITKNEEEYIENCLRSVIDISDEIIIVDTGSTDKTIEIAKKYTDKIFLLEWENDFSKARNESIKHAKCDWILYLDADEILDFETSKKLKKYLYYLDNKPYVITGNIILPDKFSFVRSVLFRNNHNIRFEEKVHEQLRGENILYLHYKIIKIYVTRYENLAKIEEKSIRYSKLLEESLKNEKDDLILAYKYRCLANSCNQEAKIKNYFEKALNIVNENLKIVNNEFREGLFSEYIEFLIKIKDFNKALNMSKELISYYPENYIAGYYMALCLVRLGKIQDAFDILQSELNHINNFKNCLMDKNHLKALINIELARIELIKGDEENYYSHLLVAKDLYSFLEIDLYLFLYSLIKEDLKSSIKYIHSISNSYDIDKLIIVSQNYKNERIYYQYILNLLNEVKKTYNLLIDKEIWLVENKIIELEYKIKNINNELLKVKDNLPKIKVIVKVLKNSLISSENINKLKYISDDIILISKNKIENDEYNIINLDYIDDIEIVNKLNKDISNNGIDYFLLINSYEQISENTIIKLQEVLKNKDIDIFYTKIQNIHIDESKQFYNFREFIFKNKEYDYVLPEQKDKSYKKILIYNLYFLFQNSQAYLLDEINMLEKKLNNNFLQNIFIYKQIADSYNYYINDYKKAIEFYYKAINLYEQNNLDNTNNFYIEILLGLIRSNILLENKFSIEFLDKTIDLIPNIPDIIYYLAKLNDIQGNIKKSIEVLKYLESLFESKSSLNISKISSFEQSIRILLFIELSKLYKKENNTLLEENYLEKAYLQSPNSMYVNLKLSKFYLFDNNLDKSLNYLINSRLINISEKDKILLRTCINQEKDSENYMKLYKFILSNLLKYKYWDKYEKLELMDKEFSFI